MYTISNLFVMGPIILLLILLINFLEKMSKNQPNTSVYHEQTRDPTRVQKKLILKKNKMITVDENVIKSFLTEDETRIKSLLEFYHQCRDLHEEKQFNTLRSINGRRISRTTDKRSFGSIC